MSHKRRQDDLLNEFLDQLAHDINAPAPNGLDTGIVDFARRLAISEQTRPASHELQHQIWDQLIASQTMASTKPSNHYEPSSNGHYPHLIELPTRHSEAYNDKAQQPRWTKSTIRVAAVIVFLLFSATLVYLIQLNSDESTQTSPINSSSLLSTPTLEPTSQPNPANNVFSLPPNQDQAEMLEVGESVTNTIGPGAYYVYTFNVEAGNIYTFESVSDQRVTFYHQALNRPAIGSNSRESGSGGGGGGGGGGGANEEVHHLSGSISVTQDSVVWLSVENTNGQLPVTYTLTLGRVEFPQITYGDTFSAPFVPAVGQLNWQFVGQRGDIITINVESTIDTSVYLQNLDGTFEVSDDDSGAGLNPEIYHVQLPADDTYRISVRPHGGYEVNTTAQISLSKSDPLQFVDGIVHVQLSAKQLGEVVTFEGAAGERVQLEATPFDSVSFTSITVIQNGETIASIDLLPNAYDASMESLPSQSQDFIIPADETVSIFLNTSVPTDNNGAVPEIFFTQVELHLTYLADEG